MACTPRQDKKQAIIRCLRKLGYDKIINKNGNTKKILNICLIIISVAIFVGSIIGVLSHSVSILSYLIIIGIDIKTLIQQIDKGISISHDKSEVTISKPNLIFAIVFSLLSIVLIFPIAVLIRDSIVSHAIQIPFSLKLFFVFHYFVGLCIDIITIISRMFEAKSEEKYYKHNKE